MDGPSVQKWPKSKKKSIGDGAYQFETVGRACAHALTQQLNQLAFRRDAVKSAAILYLYYQLKYFL